MRLLCLEKCEPSGERGRDDDSQYKEFSGRKFPLAFPSNVIERPALVLWHFTNFTLATALLYWGNWEARRGVRKWIAMWRELEGLEQGRQCGVIETEVRAHRLQVEQAGSLAAYAQGCLETERLFLRINGRWYVALF